jgi:phospholipid/cholesterol/gamma-HCH transport system substrate-binding protein
LIGSKFVNIKIGADDEYFRSGDMIDFTESTMDLEDLIGRFLFNSGDKK